MNGKDAFHRRRRIVHMQFRCSTKVNLLHLFDKYRRLGHKTSGGQRFFKFSILAKSHEKGPFDRHRRSRLSVWNATFRWVESLMRRGIFPFLQTHRLHRWKFHQKQSKFHFSKKLGWNHFIHYTVTWLKNDFHWTDDEQSRSIFTDNESNQ